MALVRKPARRLPSTGLIDNRMIAGAINDLFAGRIDLVGEVTLTASATSTDVNDLRVTKNSAVLLTPMTAHASADIGAGTIYIGTYGAGSFTITHASNTNTDRTFRYVVMT